MNSLRLYFRLIVTSMKAQMQFPGAFLMMSAGQFLATIIEFVGIWAMFDRFRALRGWSLGEVAMFYGVVNMAFALADAVARGFDVFGAQFVKTGNFDRVLLRPRSAALQIFGFEFRLTRVGRLLQGAIVLGIATHLLKLDWQWTDFALIAFAVAGGVALFSGLVMLQATLSFWTVESLEITNTLTYGGVAAAQYPLEIYASWFRQFFIFIVPLGCIAYFPVVGVLHRPDPLGAPEWFLYASPLAGFAFLALSFLAWRYGVRRYTSTGT